jgi:hypothetical protein
MDRMLDLYCVLLKGVIALCLAVMVVLVFGNVVLRYGFNSGITVSEELSRWLLVWLTFLGAIVAVREHAHLGVDTLVRMLPPAGKRICFIINYCLMLYATGFCSREAGARPSSICKTARPQPDYRWAFSILSALSLACRPASFFSTICCGLFWVRRAKPIW